MNLVQENPQIILKDHGCGTLYELANLTSRRVDPRSNSEFLINRHIHYQVNSFVPVKTTTKPLHGPFYIAVYYLLYSDVDVLNWIAQANLLKPGSCWKQEGTSKQNTNFFLSNRRSGSISKWNSFKTHSNQHNDKSKQKKITKRKKNLVIK